MKINVTIMICLLLAATLCAQDNNVEFEFLGNVTLERVRSFQLDDDNLFLCLGNSVGVIDLNQPGAQLSLDFKIDLLHTYEKCYLAKETLLLFNTGGELAIVDLPTQYVEAELTLKDSLFSIAHYGDILILAQGFAGVAVAILDDAGSLEIEERATNGVRYSHLEIYDSLLFAVDDFNGVDVFALQDDELLYRQTVLTEHPPTDLCYYDNSLYVCYGNTDMTEHYLWEESHTLADIHNFEKRLFKLDNAGQTALLGFEQGVVATYDLTAKRIAAVKQLAMPLNSFTFQRNDDGNRVLALDSRGNLEVLSERAGDLATLATFASGEIPAAMAAVEDRLLVALTGKGLFWYNFHSASPHPLPAWQSGIPVTALAVDDGHLFVATGKPASVLIFEISEMLQRPILTISLSLDSKQLQVERVFPGKVKLTSFGSSGGEGHYVDFRSDSFEQVWLQESTMPVRYGYAFGEKFIFAGDDDYLRLYCQDCNRGGPLFLDRFTPRAKTEALLSPLRSYFIVAGDSRVTVDYFAAPYVSFSPLAEIVPEGNPIELAYNSDANVVFFSTDNSLSYFQFSRFESDPTVTELAVIDNIVEVVTAGEYVYALTLDAIFAFKSNGQAAAEIEEEAIARTVKLSAGFPNPFNSSVTLELSFEGSAVLEGEVEYQIVNILGQVIRQGQLDDGRSRLQFNWDGTNSRSEQVASGVYLFQVRVGDIKMSRKLIYLR